MPFIDSVDRFLETWCGLAHPRASRAIANAGFIPDASSTYCPRCGATVGEGEVASDARCAACRNETIHFEKCVRLSVYESNDSPNDASTWIHALKFHRWNDIGHALGGLLGECIQREIELDRELTLVVPAPMPWQRRVYRGIDHARVIAGGCARALDVPMFPILAKRNGATQMSLTATQRRTNLRNRIFVRRRIGGWRLSGLTVILVDDVKTTGTTLNTASRLLKQACGAERVIAAVIAVADGPGRSGVVRSSRGEN